MEFNVTSRNPSPVSFGAEQTKKKSDSLIKLTQAILTSSIGEKTSMEGHTATTLTSKESSALGRLFRPLKTFIKEQLNLPLSPKELANKIEEFAASPACKALGGPSLNTKQIYSLAKDILSRESAIAPSLRNRANEGGKSLNLF